MRDLSKLNFKRTYDPCADGSRVLDEVYIPCLENSIKYDRCSAYFSTASLLNMATGLEKFIKNNNGKIRFIFSCDIDEKEMELISDGYEQKMNQLADTIDIDNLSSYQLANLSYLISIGVAEVKIAFMLNSKTSIMHSKFGTFSDELGNDVYFFGSGNETKQGILDNAELIQVSTSNNPAYLEDIADGKQRFEKMWNNTYAPSAVFTEYPTGKLFDKLMSYNKNRIFENEVDFYTFNNCDYIDVDIDNSKILITDYTLEKFISNPMVLATYLGDMWHFESENKYSISKLNIHIIKDILIPNLEKYDINYVLSPLTQIFLNTHDFKFDERIKLAMAVKSNTQKDLWYNKYIEFMKIVNNEMTAKLKEQQMMNAFFHYCMKSSCDFSVPGTGKTYISYGLYAYLSSKKTNNNIKRIVVFGPLNCFKAWKDEGKNIFFGKRNMTFFDINEHRNDYEDHIKYNKYDVYLFNYEFIGENKLAFLSNTLLDENTLLIFDEIHKLKNPKGIRASLFVRLIEESKKKPIYKLALTGTPIPNSFTDVYNYIRMLYPDDIYGVFNSLSYNRLNNADSSKQFEKEVTESLQPLFVRTTKKDLKIPLAEPDDIDTLRVETNELESELLKYVVKTYNNPLERFIRLIQASSNPELLLKGLDKDDFSGLYDDDNFMDEFEGIEKTAIYSSEMKEIINLNPDSGKFTKTVDLIRELTLSGNKVIVWCLFINTIDKLVKRLNEMGIETISITGRDDPISRERLIDSFKNGNKKVLITNPNTLAESVSLHKVCHNAIYLEFGFNLTYLLQSKDRIHRVGLNDTDKTNYYFAITEDDNSIDQYIYDRLELKAERMKRVIESNDLILFNDDEDIKDILKIVSSL